MTPALGEVDLARARRPAPRSPGGLDVVARPRPDRSQCATGPRRPRLLQGHVPRAAGRGRDRPRAGARRAARRPTSARSPTAARGRWRRCSPRSAARPPAPRSHDPLGRRGAGRVRAARGRRRRRSSRWPQASGLGLVAEGERDAEAASSARHRRADRRGGRAPARRSCWSRAGGSATTDGGAGAIEAIEDAGGLRGARLVVLCDVRTPFERAARGFAPQKGADAAAVRAAGAAARRAGARRCRATRAAWPMTGAAGGLAGGLWAAFGARLEPGAPFVLDALGFDARMRAAARRRRRRGPARRADARRARRSARSATRARQAGVPCHADRRHATRSTRSARGILDLQRVLEATTLEEIEAAARAWRDLPTGDGSDSRLARRGPSAGGPSSTCPARGRAAPSSIGAGSFGTAVAVLLARGGLRTTLQARTAEQAERLRRAREPRLPPGRRAAARAADRAGRAPGSRAPTSSSSASPRAGSTR